MKSSSKTHKIVYTIAIEVPYEEELLQYSQLSADKIKEVIGQIKHPCFQVNTGLWQNQIGIREVPLNKYKEYNEEEVPLN